MPQFSNPNSRWTAITNRDPAASNAFIYCVTTTKIYCRPTCPARLARRANVVFHDTAAEAEAAGFRACMRCRPGELNQSIGDPQRIAVSQACDLIQREGEGDEKWGVKGLAKEVGLTESHFCRVFKKIKGVTVKEYRAQLAIKSDRGGPEMALTKPLPALHVPDSLLQIQYSVPGLPTQDSLRPFDSEMARYWKDSSSTSSLTGPIFLGVEG